MAIKIPADLMAMVHHDPDRENPFIPTWLEQLENPMEFTNKPDRPRRADLISRFFPEIRQQLLPADRDAVSQLSLRASEAILADFIDQHDKLRKRHGNQPGLLQIMLAGHDDQQAFYYNEQDLEQDQGEAYCRRDVVMIDYFGQLLKAIHHYDNADYALVNLTDHTTSQLFPIRRENPAAALEELLDAHVSS